MKKVILTAILSLLLFSPSMSEARWNIEYSKNNHGQTIVRVINHNPRPVSCYFRDNFSYYTFVVPPRAVSGWFLPAGQFNINCR